MPTACSLYPIVDFAICRQHGLLPLEVAKVALDAAPRWLQLRAKAAPSDQVLAVLDALVEPARERGVELVINDRVDLAELSGTPWVHLGQGDLAPSLVKRFAPRLRIGVSTHSLVELERALEQAPDYVAFGPIFPTASKQRPEPAVGVEQLVLAHAMTRRVGVPLVAIGGIDTERMSEVAEHCEAVSVISALFARGARPGEVAAQLEALSACCRR